MSEVRQDGSGWWSWDFHGKRYPTKEEAEAAFAAQDDKEAKHG